MIGQQRDDQVEAPHIDGEPATPRQAHAEIEQLRAQVTQAHAEMANLRRRGEQDKAESLRFAAATTIAQFLPLIDDFERAVSQLPSALHDDPWVTGVVMINDGLSGLLERQGVERIAPWHEPFDPSYHEAISRLVDSSVPENTVVKVYRPGYRLHGRVLRPAQVGVAVRGQQ